MRYDAYEQKIKKIASVLKVMLRHIVKIIIAVALLTVIVAALLVAKGTVISAKCPEEAVYGTTLDCKASAFLSKARYEYSESGGEWVEGLPKTVGEYKIRVAARTTIGTKRYSDEMPLTIHPKDIDVIFATGSVEYGALPKLTGALAYADKIECESFSFGEYLQAVSGDVTSAITPNKDALRIVDADGKDVTSSYNVKVSEEVMKIIPKPLGITVSDKSAVYNGIKFSYDGYEISGGELVEGDTLQAVFSAYLIDVGSVPNTPTLTVTDKNGKNITYCYALSVKVGKLTVEPKPLVITTGSSGFTYDDGWWGHADYELSSDTPLVSGQHMTVTKLTEIRDVGEKENVLGFEISDGYEDKTGNYSIFLVAGTLTMKPKSVTVNTQSDSFTYDDTDHIYDSAQAVGIIDGHTSSFDPVIIRFAGEYVNKISLEIESADGRNVTKNYNITYNNGTIVVDKRAVTIIPSGNTWEYDGEAHCELGFSYGGNGTMLVDWHTLIVSESTGITNVGSAINSFTKYEIYNTENPSENVASNYVLTVLDGGVLRVTPRPITVAPVLVDEVYDDTLHSANHIDLVDGKLVNGHYLSGFSVSGSRVYPGETASYVTVKPKVIDAAGRDVTYNYDVDTASGLVVIRPRPITIVPNDVEKVYDGTPLLPEAAAVASYSEYGLVKGHTLASYKLEGYQLDAAISLSYAYDAVIRDSKNNDVTEYYDIYYDYGSLIVKQRAISIKPVDVETVYDGKYHGATQWEYMTNTPYTLVSGETLEYLEFYGDRKDVGTSETGIIDGSIYIKAADGRDSTNNYAVTLNVGYITITRRAIRIKAVAINRVYDGTKTVPTTIECTWESPFPLVDGHSGTIDLIVPYADVGTYGSSEYKASLRICDEYGDNVTDNYQVDFDESYLYTVTTYPRDVILRPADEKKVYDGKPLYPKTVICADNSPYELAMGHSATAWFLGEQTEVGQSTSQISEGGVGFFDSEGNLVTKNYNIIGYESGTLTVTEKKETPGGGGGGGGGGLGLDGGLGDDGYSEGDGEMIVCYRLKSNVSGPAYLKLKSFGDYTGSGFSDAPEYVKLMEGKYGASYLTGYALLDSGVGIDRIEIESLTGQYALPYNMLPVYDSGVEYNIQTGDTLFTGDADSIYSLYYSSSYDWSRAYYISDGAVSKYETMYREHVYSTYLNIDTASEEYMLKLVNTNGLYKDSMAETVLAIAAYIQNAAKYNLEYDRTLDTKKNVAISFLETYKEGVCRHYAAAATLMYRAVGIPARYTVGYMGETVADEWTEVTSDKGHAWVEVYIDGVGWVQVEVTGSSDDMGGEHPGGGEMVQVIEITPTYQYKKYDGTWLYAESNISGNLFFSDLLEQKYTYDVVVSGQQLDIGAGISKIDSFILYDSGGRDVTDQFEIIMNDGVLEILPPDMTVIEVQLYQLQKYYNGKPLYYDEGDYHVLTYLNGAKLVLDLNISLTEVGVLTFSELNSRVEKYASYAVYDREGKEITDEYRIIFVPYYGEYENALTVDMRPIEITTASQEKEYDGEPLSNGSYYITKGSLASGHTLKVTVNSEITEVGSTFNDVENIDIVDQNGNSVLNNYKILVVQGELTILPIS